MHARDVTPEQSKPVNLEAEQGLLGAVLLNNDNFNSVSGFLSDEHFHEPIHRAIWAAVSARIHDGRLASPITLIGDLAPLDDPVLRAGPYLAQLAADAWTASDVTGIAREIVTLAVRRKLLSISADIFDHVHLPGSKPQHVISATELDLIELADELDRLQPRPGQSNPDWVLAEIRAKMDSGDHWKGAQCGLSAIDKILGGFEPGDFVVLAGRPSMGKTLLALAMARRGSSLGYGVGFVSIEMSGAQVWRRLIADEAETRGIRVAYSGMARGKVEVDNFETLSRATERLKTLPLRIIDRGNRLSDLPGHIRNIRRWLAKRGKALDLLFVDYLGLLKSGDRYAGQRVNEVTEISSTIKALAKREGVAIFGLHQLNRANETRDDFRPRMSELRESGALEQDADVVIFVHREEYYISRPGYRRFASDQERIEALVASERKLEAIIAKNRNGPIGTASLWCDMATNSVRDEAG